MFIKKHPLSYENLRFSTFADFFLDNRGILTKFTFNQFQKPSFATSLWRPDFCPKNYDLITKALFGPGLIDYLCFELFCFYHFPNIRLTIEPKKEIIKELSNSDSSFEKFCDHFSAVSTAPNNPVLLALILAVRQLEKDELNKIQESKNDYESSYPMGVFVPAEYKQVLKIAVSFFDLPENERHRSVLLNAFDEQYAIYKKYLLHLIEELRIDEQKRELDQEIQKELASEALAQQELSPGTDPYDYEPGDPESPFRPAEGKTMYPPRPDPRTWDF